MLTTNGYIIGSSPLWTPTGVEDVSTSDQAVQLLTCRPPHNVRLKKIGHALLRASRSTRLIPLSLPQHPLTPSVGRCAADELDDSRERYVRVLMINLCLSRCIVSAISGRSRVTRWHISFEAHISLDASSSTAHCTIPCQASID